jgi:hypothetical protein
LPEERAADRYGDDRSDRRGLHGGEASEKARIQLLADEQDAGEGSIEGCGEAGPRSRRDEDVHFGDRGASSVPDHCSEGGADMYGRTFAPDHEARGHRRETADEFHRNNSPPAKGRTNVMDDAFHFVDSAPHGFRSEAMDEERGKRDQKPGEQGGGQPARYPARKHDPVLARREGADEAVALVDASVERRCRKPGEDADHGGGDHQAKRRRFAAGVERR